jgi:hypothetical protein
MHRKENYGEIIPPVEDITTENLGYHLSRFILEVRKKDEAEFPPESLHHIVCGIQRHLRFHGKPEIEFFKDAQFAEFRMSK